MLQFLIAAYLSPWGFVFSSHNSDAMMCLEAIEYLKNKRNVVEPFYTGFETCFAPSAQRCWLENTI